MKAFESVPFLQLLATTLVLVAFSGCATLSDIGNSVQKPTVSVQNVRVTDFNFEEMELTYDLVLDNPNAVSLQMLAYDYNLDINENSLVSGQQSAKQTIDASGQSTFSIPVSVNFQDMYGAIKKYGSTDDTSYSFLSNITVDLPVLGQTKLPVRKSGTIPVLRMPEIRLTDWSMGNVSFSGTDVTVQLAFDNPNAFGIDINALEYNLMINGDRWAEGTALENVRINKNGRTELNIPISLSFSDIGMSAYQILTGSEPFEYRIKGSFKLNVLHEMLGQTALDFDRTGTLSLSR